MLASVLKMPDDEIDDYLTVVAEIAEASGGGITDPPQVVGDCPDWDDNRVLDLAWPWQSALFWWCPLTLI